MHGFYFASFSYPCLGEKFEIDDRGILTLNRNLGRFVCQLKAHVFFLLVMEACVPLFISSSVQDCAEVLY